MYVSPQSQIPLTWPILFAPLLVAAVLIFLISLFREPGRRKFSAVFLAGAGAAYLSGGLGIAEFAFCALITFLAYRGLDNYRYIAIGWVLHTCWDLAHHYLFDWLCDMRPWPRRLLRDWGAVDCT